MTGASMQHALLLVRCRIPLVPSSGSQPTIQQHIVHAARSRTCKLQALSRRGFATKPKPQRSASPKQTSSRPPPPKPFARENETVPNSKTGKQSSPAQPQSAPNLPFTGTKGTAPPVPTSTQAIYPAQLLVYHASTPLVVFVSTVKFVSILVFVFCTVAIAPSFYLDPLEPNYKVALSIAGGLFPILLNIFAVPSLITYVHIHLPPWARLSSARLHQYLQKLPPGAVLDLSAVRWIWPRVSRVPSSELYLQQSSKMSYRLKRNVPKEVYDARKWYSWRPIKTFLVAGKSGKVKDDKAWGEILTSIRRGWAKDPRFAKSTNS